MEPEIHTFQEPVQVKLRVTKPTYLDWQAFSADNIMQERLEKLPENEIVYLSVNKIYIYDNGLWVLQVVRTTKSKNGQPMLYAHVLFQFYQPEFINSNPTIIP